VQPIDPFGAQLRIALLATCLADALFPAAAISTVSLLERLGHEVIFPGDQTCCGQMHINTGDVAEATRLVQHHVEVFERSRCDVVVAPSASCVGCVRHQHAWAARRAGDDALAGRAEELASRTYELSEFLFDVLNVRDVGAHYPHRVVYHPTCHSLRMLRSGDKPLELLRNVSGLTLVELQSSETCCGFGGTFAIKNADTSTAMLADKMAHIISSGAELCTAGDSSCLMHIGGGLSRIRSAVRTVHLAEILACTDSTRPSTGMR
jgi:L-lactate dehydrogenase complex protein LldE